MTHTLNVPGIPEDLWEDLHELKGPVRSWKAWLYDIRDEIMRQVRRRELVEKELQLLKHDNKRLKKRVEELQIEAEDPT